MFKFLRKYSVWILGFGGTLLLIAFLAPNVIQQLAQRAGYSSATQATVGDGETVGFNEWQQNVMESQIIDRLGSNIQGVGKLESPSHWFLLTREADQAGFTPPIQAVAIDDQTLLNIAGNIGTRPITVLEALAHLQGVQRLARTYQSAGRFSDRRLNKSADDLLSSVAVETVAIPAKPEDNGSFSDEAMQVQMDKWGETPKGEGDHGFGYKLPDRFKIEWLLIPSDSISEASKKSKSFSSREQRKYWRRNESDPRFPPIESGSKIPDIVSETYLGTLTDKTRTEISRSTTEQLRNPRRGIEELNGFYELPENWDSTRLNLEDLSSSLQNEYQIPLPEYGSVATWTSVQDANEIPVIGELQATNLGDLPIDLQTLVSASKEFDGNSVYRIQEGLSSQVLESKDGDLFVFRITDSDPSRKPNDISDVRESVAYDLGRIARWDNLLAETDIIEKDARENGLLATALKFDSIVSKPTPISLVDTGVPAILDPATARSLMTQTIVQRLSAGQGIEDMSSTIPSLANNDPEVVKAIIERASGLPIDVPISSLPIDQRIFVIPSHENMALLLVRVTGTTPASSELAKEFSSGTSNILPSLISFEELGGIENITEAFSFDSLADRHNFERGRQVAEENTVNTVN
jgi:hypothetical protein